MFWRPFQAQKKKKKEMAGLSSKANTERSVLARGRTKSEKCASMVRKVPREILRLVNLGLVASQGLTAQSALLFNSDVLVWI